jgi:microcystin-dependent protein
MPSSLVATGVQFPDNRIQTTAAASPIPTGTVMLFVQTAAPTGWTKSTAHDNKALRVVSGTASSGGSVNFTTAFASQAVSGTVGGTTLSTAQIPSHTHVIAAVNGGCTPTALFSRGSPFTNNVSNNITSQATGGGGSHDHSFSGVAINLAVQYVDVIIATKN